MRAKKSYGQHFLTNEHYAQRIAEALVHTAAYEQVLEVGPGQGMLTKYLLEQSAYTLKVVEADRDMVAHIRQHFPQLEGSIIEGDFLRLRFADHFTGQLGLIGNFPYNISSQILIKTVDNRDSIPELVGMFQKEVADRVVAGPGSKVYGVIGIIVQAFYEPALLFNVSPGNFRPPPKVQSAVIRLTRRAEPLIAAADERIFRQVVKTTFGMRRKMLRNTLKGLLPPELLLSSDYQRRPEQLSLPEFVELTHRIRDYRENQHP